MKMLLRLLCAVVLVFGLVSNGDATVINFDDILEENQGHGAIADGYAAFNWEQFGVIKSGINSNFDGGIVSGDCAAFNQFTNISTASNSKFNFVGAYFYGHLDMQEVQLTVTASRDGSVVGSTALILNSSSSVWFDIGFSNIDELSFCAGSDPENPNTYEYFVMDNFTYDSIPVPEPATATLIMFGIVCSGFLSIKRKLGK